MEQPFDLLVLLQTIQFGLEFPNIITSDNVTPIKVKELRLANSNTLLCVYHSSYSKGQDIKLEMAQIFGCFNGFFRAGSFGGWDFESFAASALNPEGEQIMFCISSKAATEMIGTGNSIAWLKNSYFQENTPDFRLSRAKTIIADIEQSLRTAIAKTLLDKWGAGWWQSGIPVNISKQVEEVYKNQFGSLTTDGAILMDYTYTLALKKIISADWGTFRHLFDKKQDFETTMLALNDIRREEAHNRSISHQHLVDLESIHKTLLTKIAVLFPEIELVYIVENWRLKIKEVMLTTPAKTAYTAEAFAAADSLERVELIRRDTVAVIEFTTTLLTRLSTIIVPLSKESLHKKLTEVITIFKSLHEEKLVLYTILTDVGLDDLLKRIESHKQLMDDFLAQFLLAES